MSNNNNNGGNDLSDVFDETMPDRMTPTLRDPMDFTSDLPPNRMMSPVETRHQHPSIESLDGIIDGSPDRKHSYFSHDESKRGTSDVPLVSRADKAVASSSILSIQHVDLSEDGEEVLEDINLSVQEGEIYGLLACNGAGKSAVLRLALGQTKPDSGRVELFGKRLKGHNPNLRRRVGYVPADDVLPENLTIAALARRGERMYKTWDKGLFKVLLDRFELSSKEKVEYMPLSHQRRLAFALSLAHRPKLLLLDQPFTGLDPIERRDSLSLIREYAMQDGRSVLISTQAVNDVEAMASRIGIIDRGRRVYQGDASSLANTIGVWSFDQASHVPGSMPGPFADKRQRIIAEISDGQRVSLFLQFAGRAPLPSESPLLPGWRRERVSLEDIFIALVEEHRRNRV